MVCCVFLRYYMRRKIKIVTLGYDWLNVVAHMYVRRTLDGGGVATPCDTTRLLPHVLKSTSAISCPFFLCHTSMTGKKIWAIMMSQWQCVADRYDCTGVYNGLDLSRRFLGHSANSGEHFCTFFPFYYYYNGALSYDSATGIYAQGSVLMCMEAVVYAGLALCFALWPRAILMLCIINSNLCAHLIALHYQW